MDFELKEKRVIVTGGTRGIGRAITLRFARSGASVLANYVRNEEAAQQVLSISQAEGLDIKVCRADITGNKGMERLLSTFDEIEWSGSLHALIHCAATGIHKAVEELSPKHFDWTFSVNVRAFLDLVIKLLPHFGTKASIVAISSLGARRAAKTYSLVGASKGALESLARHLAIELGPRGIRVNIICPGTVETEAWKVLPNSAQRISDAKSKSIIGRLVTPEEVAYCAQFLCSDSASGIVGHTLVVDGGEGLPL